MSNGISTNARRRPRFPLSLLGLERPTALRSYGVSDLFRFLLRVGFAGADASLWMNSSSVSAVVSASETHGRPFMRIEARRDMTRSNYVVGSNTSTSPAEFEKERLVTSL